MYDAVRRLFTLLTVLRVQWLKSIYAKAVIRDVNVARRVSVERRVATVSRFLHVRSQKSESHASPVTEILEVDHISKNIRQTSWKVKIQSAKRGEIAPCVKRA